MDLRGNYCSLVSMQMSLCRGVFVLGWMTGVGARQSFAGACLVVVAGGWGEGGRAMSPFAGVSAGVACGRGRGGRSMISFAGASPGVAVGGWGV